jgi:hypothetical protein
MQYLLLLRRNSGYENVPEYYVDTYIARLARADAEGADFVEMFAKVAVFGRASAALRCNALTHFAKPSQ